jgi:type III restriction enzyme
VKLLLKDFQAERVREFVQYLRLAQGEARLGVLQAATLCAPTGSGKTVMVTAAIEQLLQGDEEHRPDPEATFLWVTDQPELNEQTRRSMLATSSVLGPSKLVVIDLFFDQETFKPGNVYFLNIQKLGKEKRLVTPGDDRTFTIWETVSNTVNVRPGQFFVLIDEAHRGMSESPKDRQEAVTIIQKFIKGSRGEIPPIPLIAGISATPERFHRLIEGTKRIARPVEVPAEEVRDSGLLKEIITLYHPAKDQPSDMTMLRAAAESWRGFARHWADYCQAQSEPPVRPILVVQVQDGTAKQLSKTDITEAMRVIEGAVGALPASAFAHAFQEGVRLEVGERELRYLAPPDIHADPEVQVVFFKSSLNTGWDCPRAEVMMSFRTAVDATLIAQLVGRMVRTPLARRIDADEYLNTVALYLPHYDETGLHRVVDRLTAPDPDILPPVSIVKGEDLITLHRAGASEEAFAALAALPSYIVPRARKSSEVRRLMKLSRLLAHDDIQEDGPERATKILLDVLRAEYNRTKRTKQFKAIVEEKGKLKIRAVQWRLGGVLEEEAEEIELDIASANIDDLFEAVGRTLGEGLHKAWWKARAEQDPEAKIKAKLALFALCAEMDVIPKVEAAAQKTVQKWLQDRRASIDKLAEARRQAYTEIRRLAADPEVSPLAYPETIETRKAEKLWKKHLYGDGKALFPATFNNWEKATITPEIERPEVVGWLRNPDRKPWSLCIPYELGGKEWHPLYPDFLVVRRTATGLAVDLLDPHSIELADAPDKARGLAKYADKHRHSFGRIELIIVEGDKLIRLDLADERTCDRVKGVSTHEHLRQLFHLALN